MKKSFSIALLSFFLMHLAGFYVYFIIRQSQIHQEMRSKLKELPADQFEIISLSTDEYRQFLKGDDELEVNGKMYDIGRIEIKNDQVTVYGLHDSAEDNLLSFLDQVLENASQDSQQTPSALFQFNFLTFVLPSSFTYKVTSPISGSAFTSYFVSNLSFISSLDTPPPRI